MNEQVLDFDDIFDVWHRAWWERPGVWIGLVCGVILLGLALYFLFQWYCSRVSMRDPREAALKRLYAVNPVIGFKKQHEFKRFYTEILATIKEYLARRYGYKSLGQTDCELLDHLEKNCNATVFFPIVKQLVDHGLTIKFASLSGKAEQAQSDYSAVLEAFSREARVQDYK